MEVSGVGVFLAVPKLAQMSIWQLGLNTKKGVSE